MLPASGPRFDGFQSMMMAASFVFFLVDCCYRCERGVAATKLHLRDILAHDRKMAVRDLT